MTNNANDGLSLDDPDRLPWLETADGYDYDEGPSPLKIATMVLGGLALLAAIVYAIYMLQRNQVGGSGNGEVIAAQEGSYKVAPNDPEGKKFEGEGDAAFAASEGKKSGATIDPAKAKAAAAADKAKAGAAPTKVGPVPAGAVLVQLGAFGDAAKANTAWAAMSKRFGFLSGLSHKVAEGAGEGGRKVYRLQAAAGDAASAQQLCAKLKAAGENCLVVK